jgi:hypothetical protein
MRITTIVVLGLITACGQNQNANVKATLENFSSYLPDGTHTVDLVKMIHQPVVSELSKNSTGYEYIKTGTETITINYSGDKITFQSAGQLEIFNNVSIDMNDLGITVENIILSEVDTVNVIKDDNALNSSWKGYSWHNIINYDRNDSKSLSMTICKLAKTKKTFVGLVILDGRIDRRFQFLL